MPYARPTSSATTSRTALSRTRESPWRNRHRILGGQGNLVDQRHYAPERGQIVWISFDAQAGPEQIWTGLLPILGIEYGFREEPAAWVEPNCERIRAMVWGCSQEMNGTICVGATFLSTWKPEDRALNNVQRLVPDLLEVPTSEYRQ